MKNRELVFDIDRQERQETWLDACSIDWKLRFYLEPVRPLVIKASQRWMR